MATVTANTSLNLNQVNLYDLNLTDYFDFYDNANLSFNGIVYQDVIDLSDDLGGGLYDSWLFGGSNITVNASNQVTGGTVTGFVHGVTNGSGLVSLDWAVQGFSIGATTIANAAATISTSDDVSVLSSIFGGADTFNLSPDADLVRGFAGADTIRGNGGGDVLYGDGGNDRIEGGDGNDQLIGGTEADTMLGGAGNDLYVVDNASDAVYETTGTGTTIDAGGVDSVNSSVTFNLNANAGVKFVEKLTLTGVGNVNATGNALANVILGNAGNNVISGGGGKDTLKGGAGADTFTGGGGGDVIYAGQDSVTDVIDINAKAESGIGSSARDKVYQFVSGTDDIDLRTIDANSAVANDQAFSFSASGAAANSIWIVDIGTDLLVKGDVNGDSVADFEIQVIGVNALVAGDFLL